MYVHENNNFRYLLLPRVQSSLYATLLKDIRHNTCSFACQKEYAAAATSVTMNTTMLKHNDDVNASENDTVTNCPPLLH